MEDCVKLTEACIPVGAWDKMAHAPAGIQASVKMAQGDLQRSNGQTHSGLAI